MLEPKFKKMFSEQREKRLVWFNKSFEIEWSKNGKFHRDNGLPAIFYLDGSMEWWENDCFIKRKNMKK